MATIRIILFLCIQGILVILPATCILLMLQSQPLIIAASITASDIDQAKHFIQHHQQQRQSKQFKVSASEKDLNSLSALLHQQYRLLAIEFKMHTNALDVFFTISLPKNALGNYINGHAVILPSNQGLKFSHLKLGQLEFSSQWLAGIQNILSETWFPPILQNIKRIAFQNQKIFVQYQALKIDKIKKILNKHLAIQVKVPIHVINLYYQKLVAIVKRRPSYYPTSLSYFIGKLMHYSKNQSNYDAITENYASIYALALYFGDRRLAKLMQFQRNPLPEREMLKKTTLRKRQDLMQHFIISAGLTLLITPKLADDIGFLKELDDTNPSGSGFSFKDLAADQAGIYFAKFAVSSENNAQHMQQLLANRQDEQLFFPDITGLPEKLSTQEFNQNYQYIGSIKYLTMLENIKRRIQRRTLYHPYPKPKAHLSLPK